MIEVMMILSSALALATPAQPAPKPAPRFNEKLLAAHNAERKALGAPPLVWSDRLARDARTWADTLARTDTFDHAPEGREPQGENLWMGTRDAYEPAEMVGLWLDERKLYRARRFPDVSTTGNWRDVGHYTQLIWSQTREVGCALAANPESDFLVCRYSPPGNWMGQFAIPQAPAKRR
ncbi:MAG TPA: CAP family protein [Chakrabartia sp.]|jgi:hypothetical protein|nr:CAP family protein [Chakrabartia sp.]